MRYRLTSSLAFFLALLCMGIQNAYSQAHSTYVDAEALYKAKSFEECKTSLDQIFASKTIFHDSTLAASYKLYGDLYLKKYELNKTIANYEIADSIYLNLGEAHALKRLNVVNKMGICYAQQDNLIMTAQYFQTVYDIASSLYGPTEMGVAKAVNNLAAVYLYLGDFDQSLKYFQESAKVKQRFVKDNPVSLAKTYENMASIYGQINQMGEAESYLNKAGQLYQMNHEGNDKALLGYYINLVGFYLENDRVDEAINQLKIAENLPEKYKADKLNVLLINKNFGVAYLEKEDYTRALSYFEKVKEQVNQFQVGQKDLAIVYTHMASIYGKQNRKHLSRLAIENASKTMLPLYGKTHKNYLELLQQQIHICLEMKDIDKAKKLVYEYENSLEQRNKIKSKDLMFSNLKMGKYAMNLNYIAVLYQNDNSKVHLEKGIEIAEEVIEYQDQVLETITDKDSKLFFFKNAFTNFSTTIFFYLEMYNKTKSASLLEKAFHLSEKAKSYSLREARGLQFPDFGSDIPTDLLNREKQTKIALGQTISQYENLLDQENKPEKMLKLINNIDSLKLEYEKVKEELISASPMFAKTSMANLSTDLESLKLYLHKKEKSYISYFLGGNDLIDKNYVFVLNSKGLSFEELSFTGDEIDKEIERLLTSLKIDLNIPMDEETLLAYVKPASSLYNMLLSDIELDPKQDVILNPHNKLHSIPFGVLKESQDGMFFIQEKGISYAYSLSSLIREDKISYDKNFLACAPDFSISNQLNLGVLENNKKEIEEIIDLVGRNSIVNSNSKELFIEEVKSHKFNIAHLATHAAANQKRGYKSYLAFGNDSTQLLYSREIYGLPIQANLVVLSACQSGDGELIESQGVLGLATAFAATSTRSMLASLWNVNDASTRRLILNYYKYLKDGVEKDEALRQAKLDYLSSVPKSKQHPFYWAGFVQIGSSDSIDFKQTSNSYLWIGFILILLCLIGSWRYNKKRAALHS